MKVRGGASAGVLAAASLIFCLLLSGCAASPHITPPRGPTAAERAVDTRAELNLRWALVTDGAPTFLRPHPAILRYTTYEDVYETIAQCLRAAGYRDTRASTVGVFNPTLNPAEEFPFEVAAYRCEAMYPEEPVEIGYLSDAQGRYLYGYWQQQTVPCLRAHGAIARDVAAMPAAGGTLAPNSALVALNPYDTVVLPAGVSRTALYVACPAFPAALLHGN